MRGGRLNLALLMAIGQQSLFRERDGLAGKPVWPAYVPPRG